MILRSSALIPMAGTIAERPASRPSAYLVSVVSKRGRSPYFHQHLPVGNSDD
jgi:hypothetical protein